MNRQCDALCYRTASQKGLFLSLSTQRVVSRRQPQQEAGVAGLSA